MNMIESTASNTAQTASLSDLQLRLQQQKSAFASAPMPSLKERLNRLNRLHNALLTYREQIHKAIDQDFAGRAVAETEMAEIIPLLEGIAYYRKRLKRFMRPQRRHAPLTVAPAKAEVHYQPLGVVGIVTPWNFPFFLALSPLIGALAAGNRAMIKASEFAPASGDLMRKMLAESFSEDEVMVSTGGVEVASEFTALPFDHLVFTGSTQVGKIVMRAAAENLTPVTLELGGKSPAIIHNDFPIDEAARRLAFGKCMNAGQICVSPDYVLCPRDKVHEFSSIFIDAVEQAYPTLKDNPDYTAIISDRQKSRLERYLNDARAKGAQLMTADAADEDLSKSRKLPMTLVLNATDNMMVMQEEIFGPILPVIPYDSLEEAIQLVNSKPRPLALYYFDWNQGRANTILATTHSGGVCINDSLSHVPADDLPFGGIGPSGMGHYHGEEGFRTFSKAKGVIRKGKINTAAMVAPPWDNRMFKGLMWFMKFRFRPVKVD
ncbi:coniferyl aldehyde dehydrogenase [Thalassolituus sp.]|uniref:coniferyl aldehyde dehydrogenase n=2 Tax=Thalassolituus sp. TaxID=2030822 RepID=UPI003514A946